jgi:hypothetical protein
LQANPVAILVVELMKERYEWAGTPTELLNKLEKLAEKYRVDTRARRWPRAAHSLSRRLNEARPTIAAAGITVSMSKSGHRLITFNNEGK